LSVASGSCQQVASEALGNGADQPSSSEHCGSPYSEHDLLLLPQHLGSPVSALCDPEPHNSRLSGGLANGAGIPAGGSPPLTGRSDSFQLSPHQSFADAEALLSDALASLDQPTAPPAVPHQSSPPPPLLPPCSSTQTTSFPCLGQCHHPSTRHLLSAQPFSTADGLRSELFCTEMLQTAPFPSSVRYDESSCGGKLCTLQVNGPCSDLDWQRLVSDWALPASALPAATSAVPPLEDLLAESDSPLQPLLTWKSVSQPPPCGPTSASSLPCSSAAAFLPLYQAYPFAGAESSLPGSSIAISAPMHGHTDLSPCFSTAVASSTPTAPIASWPHATFQPSAANTTVASPAEDPRPDSLQAPAAQSFCAVVCPDDTPTSARMASPPLSIHGPLLPVPQPASSVALAVEAAHAAAAPVGPSSPAVTSMTSVQDCALRLTAMQDTVLQHGGTASLAAASGEVRQRRSSFRAAASKAEVVAPPPPPGVLQGRAGSLTKSGCKRGRPRLYDTVTPVLDAGEPSPTPSDAKIARPYNLNLLSPPELPCLSWACTNLGGFTSN